MTDIWVVLPLNPEPWRIGPVGVARGNGRMVGTVGRDQQLHAYKEAVAEQVRMKLDAVDDYHDQYIFAGKTKLTIYLWRQRASYETHQAGTHRKHEADATNMLKATEDALQGIFYKNDKDNSDVRCVIVEQGEETIPKIVIHIELFNAFDFINEIPPNVWSQINSHDTLEGLV